MAIQAKKYRFGPYELRTRTRELYKQGTKLKLRPQPFQVLKILVERAGDVVSREELHDLLWPAETFVDFEQGLNTSIKVLRGVLSDSASEPRYIETLPKLGYRIIVPVEAQAEELVPSNETSAPGQNAGAETLASEKIADDRIPQPFFVRRWPLLAGISIALIAAALVGYFQWSRPRSAPQPTGGRTMLAVLPFDNLTGDPSQDYFSDGLTEEMIAQLGRLDPQHLGVIARTSVMHYKNTSEQLEQIGHELGVQYVLEGSVRRDSHKVRISAQLIQVTDQSHVWARQYDRELNNLLALEGEIAQEIAGGIQLTLGNTNHIDAARNQALSPSSYEAYDLYLRGLYFWNKRTTTDFERAIDYFQQAAEKDPNYARAYAGLANSYVLMAVYRDLPPKELMPKARAAALRAVELDDSLAEAHVSLGVIAQDYDWDWPTVEKEYRRAIELNPNYPTAHQWYAESLALQGRFEEAFLEIERARQLDPLSLIIGSDYAVILYFSRQYDRAIEQFRSVLDREPSFPRAHMVAYAYAEKGMYAEALADIESWHRLSGDPQSMLLAYVSGRAGQQAKARQALRNLQQLSQAEKSYAYSIAVAYIGIGDNEKAIKWLQKSYAEHTITTALRVDPIFDPLRSDPRFQELLRGMGLAQ
jgi:TolB-like protein/DNA-binding winged helix-turn-helix (wHTH) protein/Flp pilus assembly protein TadD